MIYESSVTCMNFKYQIALTFLLSLLVLSFSGCKELEELNKAETTKGKATNDISLHVYDSSGVGLEHTPDTLYISLNISGHHYLELGDGDWLEIYSETGELLNYHHVSWETCYILCGVTHYYAFQYDYDLHKVINIQFIRRNNVSAYNTEIQLPTIPEVQQYSPQTVYSVSNDTLSLDWTPDENMLPTRISVSVCNDTLWDEIMGSSATYEPGTFVSTCDGEHELSINLSRSMELTEDPVFSYTLIGHSVSTSLILTATQ